MLLSLALPNQSEPQYCRVVSEEFYQQLKVSSNTIISLQYTPNKFLTFKAYEANLGMIVHKGEDTALQCQIRGITYKLQREHLDQMSKRELTDLINHLGLDINQLR